MPLHQRPIDEFSQLTASESPTPGGGSVSALCGALAASLSAMVAKLTIGRPGHEAIESTMKEAVTELECIRQTLLKAIDEDSQSFDEYMAALKMPKVTPEEKAARNAAMQAGLIKATLVPLNVAREAVKIFDYAYLMITAGNPNALTDAMVGTLTSRTAVLGALLNVRINLGSIEDGEFYEATLNEVNLLEKKANEAEANLLKQGYLILNMKN